jgi:hypothetical protein
MKRSNNLIADVPLPASLAPNRPDRLPAKPDGRSDRQLGNKPAWQHA